MASLSVPVRTVVPSIHPSSSTAVARPRLGLHYGCCHYFRQPPFRLLVHAHAGHPSPHFSPRRLCEQHMPRISVACVGVPRCRCLQTALATPSPVFWPRARTCDLNRSPRVPAMLSVASTRTGPKSSAIIAAPGEKCGLGATLVVARSQPTSCSGRRGRPQGSPLRLVQRLPRTCDVACSMIAGLWVVEGTGNVIS